MAQCADRCAGETYQTQPCTSVTDRICSTCAARCPELYFEEVTCTEFTDRMCKELQKNLTVSFAISVPYVPPPVVNVSADGNGTNGTSNATAEPVIDLSIYKSVVAETLAVNPDYVEVSLTPFEQSARRRLLQTDIKIYFRINVPVLNVSVVLANYTVLLNSSANISSEINISSDINITRETAISQIFETINVTQIVEVVSARVQSQEFEDEIVAAFTQLEIEIIEVDTNRALATLTIEMPPCPPDSYCIGSDVYNCSAPCAPGTYRSRNCTALSDQICSPCTADSYCLGGAHRQECRAHCPAGDI